MIIINRIQSIKIQNVKGKDLLELKFNDLYANHPNLFVAPNGFGKSTIAITFEALKSNRIELNKEDLFQGREENLPSLEIEILLDDGERTLVADTTKNEISRLIDTYVINSPVYARGTSRRFGKFTSQSAKLDVENLVFFDSIPPKVEIPYKISEIKEKYGGKGKIFNNISDVFKSLKNLELLSNHYELLKKCSTQKNPEKAINTFFDQIIEKGSANEIKNNITSENLEILKDNSLISEVLQIVKEFENLPFEKDSEVDLLLTVIQIIEVIKKVGNDINKYKKYLEYIEYREDLNYKLEVFNTTGRTIKTKETKDKLVLEFFEANKMSNGERDVLSFISNLSKFKIKFKKKIGILIIDEVFDYLDGSNMLIVQYYLSQMIEDYRKQGKIFFPIILTHLDPTIFNNYYFRKPKIHYLKNYPYIKDRNMVEFLKIRSNKDSHKEIAEKIEKYYLHYHPDNIQLTGEEKILFENNYHESALFYEMIHNEIEKFLEDNKYDPLKVICAIRVKIEKILYSRLHTDEQRAIFIETHRTINKLNYAMEQGIDVPEDFFLLQPLYNDALHLNNNEHAIKNKIQSICLKLDNIVVQNIVKKIQENPTSNLVLTHT